MNIVIGGVSIIVFIELFVKLLKAFEIPSKYLALLQVLLGVALVIVAKFVGLDYNWIETIVVGIVVGGTTAGLFDARKAIGLKF